MRLTPSEAGAIVLARRWVAEKGVHLAERLKDKACNDISEFTEADWVRFTKVGREKARRIVAHLKRQRKKPDPCTCPHCGTPIQRNTICAPWADLTGFKPEWW